MTRVSVTWLGRSLRVRLAVLGFGAIYVPVLFIFGVVLVTDVDTEVREEGSVETVRTTGDRSPWLTGTLLALAPVAAGLAWWWSGRAVRPIDRIRAVIDEIEDSDLSRRIGLGKGPVEVVSVADSFDRMLDRLEVAAQTQRRLIEDTSHELRVPLSVLINNAEVLLAHPDPTVELYREGLERSRRAASRLQTTLEGLLVDARGSVRTIARHPTDLRRLVDDVVADATVLAAKKRVVLSVTGPASATAPVDPPTLTRAVSNLLDNAIRHAPTGSTVEVALEVADTEVSVSVTDHGPGIPPAFQGRVFARSWSDRRDHHGAGLGLPIAMQIAQAHGGTVTLQSPGPAGDGCVFRLTLRR